MAKKKRKSLADRFKSQVTSEARLRFGPQERALRSRISDVASGLASDVNAAEGSARGIRASVRSARPVVVKSNAEAGAAVDAAQATLAGKLPGALGTTSALSAGAARDAEGTKRRLAESLNATQTELTQRATDARAGAEFAKANARARAKTEGRKLADELQGLAGDEGTFAQGRTGQLVEAARGRSVTRRGQNKTASNQAATRDADYLKKFGITYGEFQKKSPGQRRALIKRSNAKAKDGSGGPGTASPTKRQEVSDGIGLGRSQAKRLKASGRSRSEAATALVEGRESQTITDPKTGEKVKVPGVKKVRQLYASVALDIAYDGHVSHRNAQELHKLGISLKDLGLPTAASAPKRKRLPSGSTLNPFN